VTASFGGIHRDFSGLEDGANATQICSSRSSSARIETWSPFLETQYSLPGCLLVGLFMFTFFFFFKTVFIDWWELVQSCQCVPQNCFVSPENSKRKK